MKILFLIDSLGSGGAQRQLANMAIELTRRGHLVEVVYYANESFFLKKLKENDVKCHKIKYNFRISAWINAIIYLIKSHSDIVITFLDTPNFLGNIAYLFPHKWKLITNELSAEEKSFKSVKGKIKRVLSRNTDALVCNSNNARKLWLRYYAHMNHLLRVIYNPVILTPKIEPLNQIDDRRHMVVAASYQNIKRPELLIKAIAMLKEDMRNKLRVDWYGKIEIAPHETSTYDRALSLVKSLGLESTIYLHDVTQNIYSYMKGADCIGLFSEYEGLPNAICEAMCLGKPIMMTPISDYDTLLSENNGYLCEEDTPKGVSRALIDFLSDPELEIKGRASLQLGKRLFSSDVIMTKWQELFCSLP